MRKGFLFFFPILAGLLTWVLCLSCERNLCHFFRWCLFKTRLVSFFFVLPWVDIWFLSIKHLNFFFPAYFPAIVCFYWKHSFRKKSDLKNVSVANSLFVFRAGRQIWIKANKPFRLFLCMCACVYVCAVHTCVQPTLWLSFFENQFISFHSSVP